MQTRQRWISIAIAITVLMFGCAGLWGQVTATANLQGTVEDRTGAVLSKADVTITNKATGETRGTKSNDSGEYRFDLLPVGIYNVKVNAQGFAGAEAKDVELQVGRTTTQNFALKPGSRSGPTTWTE